MDEQHAYLGLDLGSTNVKTALIAADGEVLRLEQQGTPHDDAGRLTEHVKGHIAQLTAHAAELGRGLRALGVGVTGLVDPQTRRVTISPNLTVLERLDLSAELESFVRLPLVFDNNANMAAYGEVTCGAGRGLRDVVFMSLGTGIGGGIISAGQIHRGSRGFAGEIGHTTVDPQGLKCPCGNTGCLETIASGPNIVRRAKERLFRDRSSSLSTLTMPGKGELTPALIAREALNGDDFSRMVLERTGKWVGIAVANFINLLNPDMVVLGGDVMVAGDILLRPVVEEARRRAFGPAADHCQVVSSALGSRAGVIGAAMLARDTFAGN